MQLIPKIEMGKKYLWESSPIECHCLKCGANMGHNKDKPLKTLEVVVIGTATDYDWDTASGKPICLICRAPREEPLDGWYAVQLSKYGGLFGATGCVPYTQLEPIQ